MAKDKPTEQKIFEAATELFMEKGVDRTSVRDIANKADINLALMNYYFRSKENLFDAIFAELVEKNSRKLVKVLNSDKSFKEKVTAYVSEYINILSKNPLLVSFVMSILHRSRERITEMHAINKLYSTDRFTQQIIEEAAKGKSRYENPTHFFVDMLSLIAFPFAIKLLIMDKNHLDDPGFQAFILERKQHIPEILMSGFNMQE